MKQYIYKLLFDLPHSPIINIICNAIQSSTYNSESDKFEVPLQDLATTYFQDNPNIKEGIIENTPIVWEVTTTSLNIWLV